MGAAYGVPLGGALFALEVMRGKLALRYVYHSPISLWNSLLMVCEGPGAFSIIPCLGNKLCEQTEGLTFGAVSDKAILQRLKI